jgi:asparagine synthase (glutamine-hydrolysing)
MIRLIPKMCGIFTLLNNDLYQGCIGCVGGGGGGTGTGYSDIFIKQQFDNGQHRGPEFSTIENVGIKIKMGFHRLAINGLNPNSNQPFHFGDVFLICNGEIYNYNILYEQMGVIPNTDSDCEVIYHLYIRYGIEQTIQMLDGVFAFILFDQNSLGESSHLYVARDPYGVRPLYLMNSTNPKQKTIGFASELKMLSEFNQVEITQFQPGTYSKYELAFQVMARWKPVITQRPYHNIGFEDFWHTGHTGIYDDAAVGPDDQDYDETTLKGVANKLQMAVYKRCETTERPIACLLSGGLDSSLITALVCKYNRMYGPGPGPGPGKPIETYSIGLLESEDLKYAKIVANYLGTNHTDIILSEQDFLDAIPEVIYNIESYDTTTVRASIGNYLIGKYISKNSEAKVIFNGDGSDELTGGYLYMTHAPNTVEFDRETRRLLKDIHLFDVLRSDKSISSNGLEPRTPFLDRSFVQYYMSIAATTRFHKKKQGKDLLRKAFQTEQLLPDEILFRRKEAFSDGISKTSRSLYTIIGEMTDKWFTDKYEMGPTPENIGIIFNKIYNKSAPNPAKTTEQLYYRTIFETHFPNRADIVPYFWMPKYVDATDASARTLTLYDTTTD